MCCAGVYVQMTDVFRFGLLTLDRVANDCFHGSALTEGVSDAARKAGARIDYKRKAVVLFRDDL